MTSLSIFNIAGSALQAQSQRLNVSASNIANANSVVGPGGEPYRAREVVFQVSPLGAQGTGQKIGGVAVAGVVESQQPLRVQYDAGRALADEGGYVAHSKADVVAETAKMTPGSRSPPRQG